MISLLVKLEITVLSLTPPSGNFKENPTNFDTGWGGVGKITTENLEPQIELLQL